MPPGARHSGGRVGGKKVRMMGPETRNVSPLSSRPVAANRCSLGGGVYESPRLVRIRVATGRMVVGHVDANTYCTIHIHDDQGADCAFT